MTASSLPGTTLVELGERAAWKLEFVLGVDSHSDERSTAVPSTPGQALLANLLATFFHHAGCAVERDRSGNLIATIPATLPPGEKRSPLALICHLDTARGTAPISRLYRLRNWDGQHVPFPDNPWLRVSVNRYHSTADFVGQTLLHGTGLAPIGLDNKNGIAELMTLAEVLAEHPEYRHGEILLVFRADEEINRTGALESLAQALKERGVRYAYTIDGVDPFEVNVRNFHASEARVTFTGKPFEVAVTPATLASRARFVVTGVKSHGSRAKEEGYRNALTIFLAAVAELGDLKQAIIPLEFETSLEAETNAQAVFLILGEKF